MTSKDAAKQSQAYRAAAAEYRAAGDTNAADALDDLANCIDSVLRSEAANA